MSAVEQDAVRRMVRERYAQVANAATGCCGSSGCCAAEPQESEKIGYSADEITVVPDGANMGLGCGNPQQIAALKQGEVVVDLGSGGGFDCFLAARQVGEKGRVIGIDMTPEMISKARANADRDGYKQVEFRLGEIENLPVADATVDVIMSNCVINLSPDKQRVFNESFRILRTGGRLAISDVVAIRPMPEELVKNNNALCGCISNAASVQMVEAMLAQAGFDKVVVEVRPESREFIRDWVPGSGAEEYVASATITAWKHA